MHKQFPCVQRLGCSSTYNPQVSFDPDLEPRDIEASVQLQLQTSPSHLKSWFILNATDAFARTISYIDIPNYYSWDEVGRWKRRKQAIGALGRLYPVDPRSQEQWALRLLLLHVKGHTARNIRHCLHTYVTSRTICNSLHTSHISHQTSHMYT
jgi:hypothetical protein